MESKLFGWTIEAYIALEGQPDLHALEHLVCDLHGHPAWTHHGSKSLKIFGKEIGAAP